jgi:pimeloyl-ACP methyl ester carboxylesterase
MHPAALAASVLAATLGAACLGGIQIRRVPSFSAISYGFSEKYVTLGGVRLCYVDEGRGADVVVLLPPALSNLKVWRDAIAALRERHRVIALDLPGFGKSDKPPRFRYHPETFADVTARFLDHLGVRRATLVGNSQGGAAAIAFALRWPERTARLVLVSPAGVRAQPPWKQRAVRQFATPLHLGTLNPYLAKPFLEYFVFPQNGPRALEFVSDYLALRGAGAEYQAWLRAQHRVARAAVAYDASKRLREIRTPTLIVWGEKDRVLSPELARELHRAVKGSRLTLLPGVGHMPELEVPEAFNKIVTAFFAETPLPAGEKKPPAAAPTPAPVPKKDDDEADEEKE